MMFPKNWSALLLLGMAFDVSAKSYDYIIVGGGTAGSALATRLSLGRPNAHILLLEASPSALYELRINVPGLRGSILGTNYDWNFTTVDQSGLGGRKISVNRGKALGGLSAMNYLCYDRAAAAEYEAWGEMGSEGWTWETMIDAMTKSENFTGSDKDTRGRSGPIRNIYNRVVYDVLNTWQPAGKELGLPINEEGNMHGNPIGIMFQGTNIDDRDYKRSYSANSHLPLAGSNLEVRTNTQVAKFNLKNNCGKGYTATSVTLADGTVVEATKEVILSAGSVQSPGLLELSGIGQPAVIKAAGVTPLIDLPGDGFDSFDALIFDSSGENATAELKKWIDGEASLYEYTTAAYGFLNWGQHDAKFARKIAETGLLKAFHKFAVDTIASFYHTVGTCSLLPKADGGVVDAELRVYGTDNLCVVDSSIVPIIVSGHIQTAAYGIAEVAAAKIIASAS
ncbi:choline dehydrogenase [Colletotrichum incanum]|nr:choline dehydrogenase [Colletotrichum incanum]